VAGPGLLGLLLMLGAPVAGGGIASTVCFLAALVALGRLHLPAAAPELVARGKAISGALLVVTRSRKIRMFMALATLDNALYGYFVVALVLVGDTVLTVGETGIGLLNAMFAAGAFMSMAIAPRLASARNFRWLIVTLALFAGWGMVLAMAPTLSVAAMAVFFAGLFTVVAEIIAVTAIQRVTPNAVASRVFGLYDTLAIAAIAVCTGLAGVLSEALGVRTALFAAACVTAALTLLGAVLVRGQTAGLYGQAAAVGVLPSLRSGRVGRSPAAGMHLRGTSVLHRPQRAGRLGAGGEDPATPLRSRSSPRSRPDRSSMAFSYSDVRW
jgi:hypothetical protein